MNNLDKYGIRGVTNTWINSYLTNREQFVSFNDSFSTAKTVLCGVPQGSILGSLLFLVYVNDIVNVSDKFFPILFADDTNVFIDGDNLNNMSITMNKELCKLVVWLNINKLSLNIGKTHFMIFRSRKKNCHFSTDLRINGQTITRVESTKFLGVIIDEHLTWREHINTVKNKTSRGLGVIYKARKLLNVSTLVSLYYAFIYPYLMYCIEVWGGALSSYKDVLIKIQKKIVRVMVSASYYAHTSPIF